MDEKTFTAQAKCEIARILDDLNFNEFQVDEGIKPSDIYAVWLVKVLQNNKGLFSTDVVHGHYFEVTYNGDKNEFYIDHYVKSSNTCLKGE